jgi:hypothetical protein
VSVSSSVVTPFQRVTSRRSFTNISTEADPGLVVAGLVAARTARLSVDALQHAQSAHRRPDALALESMVWR